VVRYKGKTSAQMREEYELRSDAMTLIYQKKMGPDKISKRGEAFESQYKATREKVKEFLAGLLGGRRLIGQVIVIAQNAVSEAISAYKRLKRGSAYTHLVKAAITLASLRPHILTDADIVTIGRFLAENGVPAEDVRDAFTTAGLPAP